MSAGEFPFQRWGGEFERRDAIGKTESEMVEAAFQALTIGLLLGVSYYGGIIAGEPRPGQFRQA